MKLLSLAVVGAFAASLIDGFRRSPFAFFFPFSYGRIDYTGKTVVDVGASIGDSVAFFLSRGASSVVAFEADPQARQVLALNFEQDPRVVVMGAWDGASLPPGDVLKMDCEGCEVNLTLEMLQAFPEYVVGLHPDEFSLETYQALQDIIVMTGGSYWIAEWWIGREFIFGKALVAE